MASPILDTLPPVLPACADAQDVFSRSLPARSTRCSLLLRTLTMPACGSRRLSMWHVKMQWLREDAALRSLAATWRLMIPARRTSNASDTAAHPHHRQGHGTRGQHSCIADTAHAGKQTYMLVFARARPGRRVHISFNYARFGICSTHNHCQAGWHPFMRCSARDTHHPVRDSPSSTTLSHSPST
jgi:hypothetical protein